jgi:hypothetical protein
MMGTNMYFGAIIVGIGVKVCVDVLVTVDIDGVVEVSVAAPD